MSAGRVGSRFRAWPELTGGIFKIALCDFFTGRSEFFKTLHSIDPDIGKAVGPIRSVMIIVWIVDYSIYSP